MHQLEGPPACACTYVPINRRERGWCNYTRATAQTAARAKAWTCVRTLSTSLQRLPRCCLRNHFISLKSLLERKIQRGGGQIGGGGVKRGKTGWEVMWGSVCMCACVCVSVCVWIDYKSQGLWSTHSCFTPIQMSVGKERESGKKTCTDLYCTHQSQWSSRHTHRHTTDGVGTQESIRNTFELQEQAPFPCAADAALDTHATEAATATGWIYRIWRSGYVWMAQEIRSRLWSLLLACQKRPDTESLNAPVLAISVRVYWMCEWLLHLISR